jgi:DNA-binding SARP family transcriptional activator
MPVEFRVLGPLEIRRNGSPVPLRASKPRTLLGLLLVHHGRVVSVDSLIEGLWPKSPPKGAQHAIETHASRLRALLGDDLPLAARPPGYVLDVDAGSIDSVRFERLLAEARDSEPARAAKRAADALSLWRGDAYADFTFESFAQEEIARLEELRQDAEEVRIDAELELGRSGELVGELEALVQVKPPRERRYVQLMLALYRSGRQQGALDVFGAARKSLADYGLEPSPSLRELERSILQQDRTLEVSPAQRHAAPAALRLVTVVAVAPDISLDLDPEEHARQHRRAEALVAGIAASHGAELPEPLLLVFTQEDHALRASAAAAEIHDALRAGVGVETGEALVAQGSVGGAVLERARRLAREGAAPPPAPPPLERRMEGPFVGRSRELARLRTVNAALVVGPPGIGKSRLARELGREERMIMGRCSSYATEALTPLREIVGALDAPQALDNVSAPEVPLTFRRICEAAGPLTIVFDDVHWADALVLETIEHLVERTNGHLRVVCLAREELLHERPAFLAAAERIPLEPLSADDAKLLLAELGAPDDSIVERAEGNPLFIEQLLAHATEGRDALPTSLRSLLAARLDHLTAGERAAAECAAVVGREFDAKLVAELLDTRSAREPLAALVRRGLLEAAPPTELFEERFRFRHPLIHETAYAGATQAERARLHEAAADVLDARAAPDEVVGFHLERSAELRPERDRHARRIAEDAGRRLAAAGMSTFKLGHGQRAAGLLERAVSLLPADDAARRELLCELGLARCDAGDGAGGEETLRQAVELAESTRDRRVEVRARVELAAVHHLDERAGSPRRLVELGAAAIPVLEALEDDRGLGRVRLLTGWIEGGVFGHCATWESDASRALEHYRRLGFPSSTCIGQICAATYYGATPADDGVARLVRLLDEEVDDLLGEAAVLAHLGGLEAMRGNVADGDAALSRARTIYEDVGRAPALARTCAPIEAESARLAGDLVRAAAILEASCDILSWSRNWSHFGTQAAALADVLTTLGRTDEALARAAESEQHAIPDDAWTQIAWRAAKASIEHDAALAREAVTLAESTDLLNLHARALLAVGDVASTAEAMRLYERKQNVAAAARAIAATSAPSSV